MKKKNEFCKVRQESKRNKRLFFVSTTRDIQSNYVTLPKLLIETYLYL